MSIEADMANQFVKYGDLIVGFVVAQNLAFAYSLGHKGDLRNTLLGASKFIRWAIPIGGIVYGGLIVLCGAWEHSFRQADSQSTLVLKSVSMTTLGRLFVVMIMSALASFGLHFSVRKAGMVRPDTG